MHSSATCDRALSVGSATLSSGKWIMASQPKVFASELNTGRGRYSPPNTVESETEVLIGKPDAYLDKFCRATKFKREDGMQTIHTLDQRIQQEAGKPQGVGRLALRPLQFRAGTSDAAHDTGHGR